MARSRAFRSPESPLRRLRPLLTVVVVLALSGCDDAGVDDDTTAAAPSGGASPTVATPETGPPRDTPVVEALALNDWFRAVLVDRASISNPRDLETIARSYCDGLAICRTAIWFDPAALPRAMPVSAASVDQQAYAFGRTGTGAENSLWNCNIYPEFEAERACLPRPMR